MWFIDFYLHLNNFQNPSFVGTYVTKYTFFRIFSILGPIVEDDHYYVFHYQLRIRMVYEISIIFQKYLHNFILKHHIIIFNI